MQVFLQFGICNNLAIVFFQSDDPPFLAVGTEVSAKFKGAFCEAKIKKIVKSVKCKVRQRIVKLVL